MHQLLVLCTALLLLAPWILMAMAWGKHLAIGERVAVGTAAGLAATTTAAYLFARAGHLSAYIGFYILAWMGALVLYWFRRHLSEQRITPPFPRGTSLFFWLSLAAILLTEAIPTLSTDFPLGWDPSFHCLLTQKILNTNALPTDWRPFETIDVHYPLGLHAYLALVSKWSGQSVHIAFQAHHLLLQGLAAIFIFLLAWRILNDLPAALLAMLAYGCIGFWGTFFSYTEWGGLPTELGSLLFLALIWIYLVDHRRQVVALGTLLLGGILLSHHLSGFIYAGVILFHAGVLLAGRRLDELCRRLLITLVTTAIAYSFFLVPFALQVRDLHGTSILKFRDEPILAGLAILRVLGTFLPLMGLLGIWLLRKRPGRESTLLLCWTTALLVGFCLFDHLYRFLVTMVTGESYSAFTPSRFLTLTSYPLALYAGYAGRCLGEAPARFLNRRWGAAGKRRGLEVAGLMIVAALMLAVAVPRVWTLRKTPRAVSAEAEAQCRWVREHAPPDAFVFFQGALAPQRWLPYLTGRAGNFTPIPASEDQRQVNSFHEQINRRAQDPEWLRSILAQRGLRPFKCILRRRGENELVPMQ